MSSSHKVVVMRDCQKLKWNCRH